MAAEFTPTDFLHRKTENRVEMAWADGHQSIYPVAYLRDQCPCARCAKDRREKGRSLPMANVDPVRIEDMEVVGGYAIRFRFSDGHNGGIYSFDHLREICPCPECVAARRADGGGTGGSIEMLTPL